MKKILMGMAAVLLLGTLACQQAKETTIDLSGSWHFRLDEEEKGEEEQWYKTRLPGEIQLPGALRDYAIGHEPTLKTDWTGSIYDSSWYFNPAMEKYRQAGNIKFPFWLTPVTHYKGMAWFQKDLDIPAHWAGKDLILDLERPHWQTKVWLDSVVVGSDNSLSVPHRFTIPGRLVSAGQHRLTVRVDNAIRDIDPGINSHSLSDHTQGNWNGITGSMKLFPLDDIHYKQVKLSPNLAENALKVDIELNTAPSEGRITFKLTGSNHSHSLSPLTLDWPEGQKKASFNIDMGADYQTWSEFAPNLYEATLTLEDQEGQQIQYSSPFGMREFTLGDKHFTINGTPTFLRGTTECSVFPLTGYPPTDEASWARIFEICRDFGLNHMRFHSYCPPEAAFHAADKAGIYLQVEGPSWAKYSVELGWGLPLDDYLMEETRRIIDTYGNHPSFVMMAYGNEPSGNYVAYLEDWVDHFRAYDNRFLYTGASTGGSWAIINNSDFFVRAPPRGLEWNKKRPESTFDYRNKTENLERPYITFEMGQWCVFPNFDELPKYTGSLKAKNFELFQEHLGDQHMGDQARDFLMASGKLQASSYKQEIEATLRTPNLAGFQLLSLNDFSGQGTALVGVLDAFWDEKGYISASEFSAFCNEVVPLVRLEQFTFENTDVLDTWIEIANFSGQVIDPAEVSWQLNTEDGEIAAEGVFADLTIPVGNEHRAGRIQLPLDFVQSAQKLRLSVTLDQYQNHWDLWVYPNTRIEEPSQDVLLASEWTPEVEKALNEGQKVLLLAAGKVENGKDVVQHYNPVFWNTSWFRMRPPHTTGLLIQDSHPIFHDFPTDYYSDLQWWELTNRQQVMNLENFPRSFRPQVQPIDTWFLNRRLALLFEARVGAGKLVVCSADLSNNLEQRPAARQLRHSILTYMQSEDFAPTEAVDAAIVGELFEEKERAVWQSYVNEAP